MKKNLLLLVATTLMVHTIRAQNVTSPYSILGIGDIETKDFGRYFITGNTAISRRNESSYNNTNPAALSSLPFKTMQFDVAFRGRSSVFTLPESGEHSPVTKDFIMKRGTLAFKTSQRTGLAFGLQPYSSVNYQYNKIKSISDGNELYTKYTDGSGGINQAFFSVGQNLNKHFSAGITASWLFGSLQRNTNYYSDALTLNVLKEERDFYTGGLFKAGIQYYTDAASKRKWKHTIGLTGTVSTGLKGQLTSSYSENGIQLVKELTEDRRFSLPLQAGIGYTATKNNQFSLSAEANYSYWKYQELDYKKSYTAPAFSFSLGMEYSINKKVMNGLFEKSFVGLGVHAEQSYMRINNAALRDYSVSFGGGISPARNISLYTGIELGIKGNTGAGQFKEQYTQFILGITVKDLWIGTKKFGRFY